MNPYQPGEDNQDPYEVGYKAGAASRDAEIESLRQQLAASLAACKVKDAFLHRVTVEIRWSGDPMYEAACKALAATEPR